MCLSTIIWVISSAKSNSPRCSVANGEFANVHDWWLVYADLHLDSYGFSWFAKSADVQQVSFDYLPEKQDIIERKTAKRKMNILYYPYAKNKVTFVYVPFIAKEEEIAGARL